MKIEKYAGDRLALTALFLAADEDERMLQRYLNRGEVFVALENGVIVGECLVTDEGEGVVEIKNLAVAEAFRGQGIGSGLVRHCFEIFTRSHREIHVGTGAGTATVGFYERLGFEAFRTVKGFFLQYERPIFEDGVRLVDMLYLRKTLAAGDKKPVRGSRRDPSRTGLRTPERAS